MVSAAFAACAALTLCSATPDLRSGLARRPPPAGPPAAAGRSHAGDAADLYSAHAKRLVANYLRLRLLELHREGLERVATAIEHGLPIETLLRQAGVSPTLCP